MTLYAISIFSALFIGAFGGWYAKPDNEKIRAYELAEKYLEKNETEKAYAVLCSTTDSVESCRQIYDAIAEDLRRKSCVESITRTEKFTRENQFTKSDCKVFK
jgi:hypothetical protein